MQRVAVLVFLGETELERGYSLTSSSRQRSCGSQLPIWAILLFLLAGCGVANPSSLIKDPLLGAGELNILLDGRVADYNGVAWLDDDGLVVAEVGEEFPIAEVALSWQETSTAPLRPISRGTEPGCSSNQRFDVLRMPDRGFAFYNLCVSNNTMERSSAYAMLWDVDSQSASHLFNYPLPYSRSSFSIAPDGTKAIAGRAIATDDLLWFMDQEGSVRVEVGLAVAREPAWAPAGTTVAFWGADRWDGTHTQQMGLWSFSADCVSGSPCVRIPELLVPDVASNSFPSFSPDGSVIAFSGEVARGGNGVWLYSLAEHTLIRVLGERYTKPSWSPDGTHIVMIEDIDVAPDFSWAKRRIVTADVQDVLP